MKKVQIITDGSCIGNPGPGGWACILRYGSEERELSGSEAQTTNNRMELTAAINGLKALREVCAVELVTDSQYLKQGVTEHLARWKANGWRTSNRKSVQNQDLWHQLDELASAALAKRGRNFVRKRASFPVMPHAMSSGSFSWEAREVCRRHKRVGRWVPLKPERISQSFPRLELCVRSPLARRSSGTSLFAFQCPPAKASFLHVWPASDLQ